MTEVVENKEQTRFDKLADEYESRKRHTMESILYCGKILFDAKQTMEHGKFGEFLNDSRVGESERTAQRLMSVYRNYRHLAGQKDNEKTGLLSHLGVSHMLELQKLPERFKKTVEVEEEKGGEKVKETAEVIDEEKLKDFLEKQVPYGNKMKQVKDLPLYELKKQIREEKGEFTANKTEEKTQTKSKLTESEKKTTTSPQGQQSESFEQVEEEVGKDSIKRLKQKLKEFVDTADKLNKELVGIDTSDLSTATDKEVGELKEECKKAQGYAESIAVKCGELKL